MYHLQHENADYFYSSYSISCLLQSQATYSISEEFVLEKERVLCGKNIRTGIMEICTPTVKSVSSKLAIQTKQFYKCVFTSNLRGKCN